jgi:hypothetical protein
MRVKFPLKIVLATALAGLTLSAVAASAAQAAEGPFYKIGTTRLASGETKNVSSKPSYHQLSVVALGVSVDCTSMSFANGSKITGSTGENSSGTTATLSFKGCDIEGDGSQCNVEKGEFSTNPLTGTLGYATSTRTGKLLELFKPSSGKTFATINFTGENCTFGKSMKFEGDVIAQIGKEATPIEVGAETKGLTSAVTFPAVGKTIKSIWLESAGSLTEVKLTAAKGALLYEGIGTFLTGEPSLLEIEGLPEWGVFTKK